MARAVRRFLAVVALGIALPSGRSATAGDAPVEKTETVFVAALDRVKANLAVGNADDAMKMLLDALEAHRGEDYVIGKRAMVEDLARRVAFRQKVKPPEPQSVVKGKLRKFISSTGAIEIAYKSGEPNDLVDKGGGTLMFPAHFRGPYTVTVKGDAYPGSTNEVPLIEVGAAEDPKTKQPRGWVLGFGMPTIDDGRQKRWALPHIVYVLGSDRKELVQGPVIHPATIGRPYRLDALVSGTRVSGSINGTTMGSVPKTDPEYGFAMIRVADWKEILIQGQIEPAWIQAKLDAIVDGQRKDFDAGFDIKKVLPAWIYEAAKRPAPTPGASAPTARDPSMPSSLSNLPPEHEAAYLDAVAKIATGDFEGALAVAESMRAKGAPDTATGVIACNALCHMGRPTKALVEIERALTADGKALEALLLKARILVQIGRGDALATTVGAILALPDPGIAAIEACGKILLLAGRLDDARRLSEDAAKRGLDSPDLEAINRVVVRAQAGPEWPKRFDYKTSNYHVSSDIDLDTCRKVGLALEDALADFRSSVGSTVAAPPEARQQYRVFLFSGRAGFDAYTADANSLIGRLPDQVAGLYSPVLKQLLIWNLPSRDEMMRTVRHEGFHQYLDRVQPDPPVWLNEGLAVYYETSKRVDGSLKTNLVRDDHVQALMGHPLVPMADFVRISRKDFYGNFRQSYPQAWLVVHLLRHGTPKQQALLRGLMSRLETAAGTEAIEATFDEATLKALDGDLRMHLSALANAK